MKCISCLVSWSVCWIFVVESEGGTDCWSYCNADVFAYWWFLCHEFSTVASVGEVSVIDHVHMGRVVESGVYGQLSFQVSVISTVII